MNHEHFRTARRLVNLRQGRNDWYRIENRTDGPHQVMIYDEIGYFGVTADDFVNDLAQTSGPVDLHINSPGGEIFAAKAIYNYLSQRGGVSVCIDSLAASAASFIAQAADPGKLVIAKAGSMMIHDGMGVSVGNAQDMREMAGLLDKESDTIAGIYADRSGRPVAEIRDLMRAETWFNSREAVDAGLADRIQGRETGSHDATPSATWDLTVFRNAGKYSAEDRRRMAANGQAMEDGSYPIADAEDLDNAIRAVGRGGAEHDAIRRHIIKRAKALGLSERIPGNWGADGSLGNRTDPASIWDAAAFETAFKEAVQ